VKFVIKRAALSDVVGRLQGLADKKANSLPILSNIHIESMGGVRLRAAATNLEITQTADFLADAVEEPGAMCVSAKRLADVVRLMPDGFITVATDQQDYAAVSAPGSRHRLPGAAPDGYPSRPDVADLTFLEVPARLFLGVLAGVEYSIAPEDDVRFSLKGARLELEGGRLRMAAADGHRLALAEADLDVLAVEDLAVLVPERGLQEVKKLLADSGEDARVGIARRGNHLFFQQAGRTLTVTLLTGEFPDYEQILASVRDPRPAQFTGGDLAQAIRRALLAAEGKSYAVKFEFNTMTDAAGKPSGMLVMSAQTAEAGSAVETLAAAGWSGEDLPIWFNVRYLLDFLGAVDGGVARFDLQGTMQAVRLVGEAGGVNVQCVLMPLNVPV
jgi:DNA polymerase-3 subunit beta